MLRVPTGVYQAQWGSGWSLEKQQIISVLRGAEDAVERTQGGGIGSGQLTKPNEVLHTPPRQILVHPPSQNGSSTCQIRPALSRANPTHNVSPELLRPQTQETNSQPMDAKAKELAGYLVERFRK